MGIEPTRALLLELENKRFGVTPNPKCDGRVNFGVMRGQVGAHKCRPFYIIYDAAPTSPAFEPGGPEFPPGAPRSKS